jgi:hypothetical protein
LNEISLISYGKFPRIRPSPHPPDRLKGGNPPKQLRFHLNHFPTRSTKRRKFPLHHLLNGGNPPNQPPFHLNHFSTRSTKRRKFHPNSLRPGTHQRRDSRRKTNFHLDVLNGGKFHPSSIPTRGTPETWSSTKKQISTPRPTKRWKIHETGLGPILLEKSSDRRSGTA